jgi:hypothetical protein
MRMNASTAEAKQPLSFFLLITWLFGFTIFLSAFLLFQIEPLISKFILPWFGGGPAVWTAAMFFFQLLLLGGYAYAHSLSRFDLSKQRLVHLGIGLFTAAWIVIMAFHWATPITPDASWKPAVGASPVWQIFAVLSVSVGLPFFLLSTTSSLIQSWFSHIHRRVSPYAFYVLSNVASLLALLSYPVLFEPNWTVRQQAIYWSIGFGIYALALGACVLSTRLVRKEGNAEEVDRPTPAKEHLHEIPPPGWGVKLLWIGLSSCASVMLLATTNQMCQDIASNPYLWVLPLSLYLLSFVIAFNDFQKHVRALNVFLALTAIFLGLWNLAFGHTMSLAFQIGSNAFLLFCICLFCHSELYLHRPDSRHLTSFYLMLSIGGALGGIFVNLIAPAIFPDFWEYNLGLIFCAVIIVIVAYRSQGGILRLMRIPLSVISLTLAVFIILLPVVWITKSSEISRNFYGVIKIRPLLGDIPGFEMEHGAISHGDQASSGPWHNRPTMYFTESSGIGQAFLNFPRRKTGEPLRIGIVGLGVGTLASYGRVGDVIKIYEINPDVVRFAQDTRYFTYLQDCPAHVEIVLGDARLSLERELAQNSPQQYDMLILDAFSGDSVPTHLISAEAINLYKSHLREDGVLAFNISNRHINLEPVLALEGKQIGLPGLLIAQKSPAEPLATGSVWVLFSGNTDFMEGLKLASLGRELQPTPGIRLWTDDFSNLFQVLY